MPHVVDQPAERVQLARLSDSNYHRTGHLQMVQQLATPEIVVASESLDCSMERICGLLLVRAAKRCSTSNNLSVRL